MIGEYGRYLEIMRAVRPDLDTARIAAALRSPAIVQVAWEIAVVVFYSSASRLFKRSS